METWIGWIVAWVLTDVRAWGDDGSRVRVFDTFREAVAHGRLIAPMEGVTKVTVKYVVHDYHDSGCDVCEDIYGRDAWHEGPTCGVCDALGHTADNCRSGDAPYDYRDDMLMEDGMYGM